MRETKFQFPDKTINPTNPMAIKAILKKEKFFTAQNSTLLNSYFFTREFLFEIIKADNDENFTLSGSGAFPAYVEPFRIPTDLDIQARDINKAVELLEDTVSTINNRNDGLNIKMVFKGKTSNDVLQYRTDAKIFNTESCFMLDIQASKDQFNRQKSMLKKIISTDEEFIVPVQSLETMLAKKILSILDKSGESNRMYYRTKDFYDIYMLTKNTNLEANDINKALKLELSKKIKENPKYDIYKLANTRETLPTMTQNFGTLWGKMSNHFEVDKNIDSADVLKYNLDIINEMDL